jgi:AraC-like DNA-binding protein
MGRVAHPYHKLALVVEGCGVLECEGDAVPLGPLQLVGVAAQRVHRFADEPTSPMTLAVLCVKPATSADQFGSVWPGLWASATTRALWISDGQGAEVHALLRRIAVEASSSQAHTATLVSGLALQALALLNRGCGASPPLRLASSTAFASTLIWLDSHFTEAIRIEDLAHQAGMAYRSFTDRFRQHHGCTVVQYLTQKRLNFACERLLASGDVLSSALESGFADLSHFYRVFHRHRRMTPLAFLRQHFNPTSRQ